jgi:two-component system, NtrC family, sensor kinase
MMRLSLQTPVFSVSPRTFVTYQFRIVCILALICSSSPAQNHHIDSLGRLLNTQIEDSIRVNVLTDLSYALRSHRPDSALKVGEEALKLSEETGNSYAAAAASNAIGSVHWLRGDFPQALKMYRKSLNIGEAGSYSEIIAKASINIGNIYWSQKDTANALKQYQWGLQISKEAGDLKNEARALGNIGILYTHKKNYDEALSHLLKSTERFKELDDVRNISRAYNNIGNVYRETGEHDKSLEFLDRSLKLYIQIGDMSGEANTECNIGVTYKLLKQYDPALKHYNRSLKVARDIGAQDIVKDVLLDISRISAERGDYQAAYNYNQEFLALKDSLFGIEKTRQIHELNSQHEMALLEKEKAVQESLLEKAETQRNALLLGALLLIILAFVIYRGYRFRKSSSEMLSKAYDGLQRAQKRLVHTEKMATLGQLTAGVAHEIKNPLNFVTNFSTVNEELITELQEAKGDAAKLDENLAMLLDNTTRIKKHGQRADNIVKSMLMHSRGTAGVRELTDFNALVEEAVELARHGSPSGSEPVSLQMDLKPDLGKVEVIPAEISRVILNLVGNAMYAARKRAAELNGVVEPEVIISTSINDKEATITVRDNGPGISEEVKEKLFEPFFTTKPTGIGTGLGLSLCWEIITDGHNGTIEVDSKEGEGATFTVKLPMKT